MITSFVQYRPILVDTITSVLEQSGISSNQVEYVIWYGGKPDLNVEALIAKFADRVKFVVEPDNGLYDSLGKAFQLISGDVVAYLNAGDKWSPTTAKIVLETFGSHAHVHWLCGLQSWYGEAGQMENSSLPFKFRKQLIRSGFYGRRARLPYIQQESTFWRKALLDLIDIEFLRSLKLAGDAYLWHRFAEKHDLFIVNSVLGGARFHSNHLSSDILTYNLERDSFEDSESWKLSVIACFDYLAGKLPNRWKMVLMNDIVLK